MKILAINQDWFAEELRGLGHEFRSVGISKHLDVVLERPLIELTTILEDRLNGYEPDRIVVFDNSAPVYVDGIDRAPYPTFFYSVDVHHHLQLHLSLARVFDATVVAMKDYLPHFANAGLEAEWLPLWAPWVIEPHEHKEYGAIFVGTLDKKLNPDRVAFFEELSSLVDITYLTGDYREYFPKADLVVNQTVKGDLNFRVFESMMCGAALLTEVSSNGLTDLFTPGEHLLTYEKGNAKEAAERIHAALADREALRAMAKRGRTEILAHHSALQRAKQLEQRLLKLEASTPRPNFPWMMNMSSLSIRLEKICTESSRDALIRTLAAAERGLQAQEVLREEEAIHLARACMTFQKALRHPSQELEIMRRVAETQHSPLFQVIYIRSLLNAGEVEHAHAQCARFFPEKSVGEIYQSSEQVVAGLFEIGEAEGV